MEDQSSWCGPCGEPDALASVVKGPEKGVGDVFRRPARAARSTVDKNRADQPAIAPISQQPRLSRSQPIRDATHYERLGGRRIAYEDALSVLSDATSDQQGPQKGGHDNDQQGQMAATWRINPMTHDGGVPLSFASLTDPKSEASTAQLYLAIEDMMVSDTADEAREAAEAQAALEASLHSKARNPTAPSGLAHRLANLGLSEAKMSSRRRPQAFTIQPSNPSLPTNLPHPPHSSFPAMPATEALETILGQDLDSEKIGTAALEGNVEATIAQTRSQKEKIAATIRLAFHQGRLEPLNIVMMVVGTRGDVQPFVGIGLKLQEFGHRVRLASHAVYREPSSLLVQFITGFGLEFYPLGGDPKVLSEYVVKHRGILPGWDISEVRQQQEQVRQILYSTYGACTESDPLHPDQPFKADAIVANPPAYGHTHCAERLNVPLHIVFTMPWTPTKAFPQPFARIDVDMTRCNSKARQVMNWLSYFAMEDLAWVGMAGLQRDFRCNVLGLKSWNKNTTEHAIYNSKVVGFINVELRKLTSYTPPEDLRAFLAAGPPPVYIGFGSLVVDDPNELTAMFMSALQRTGLRAIIQRGWGGLGSGYGPGAMAPPPNVLFIDSAPHDWLFQMSCAVVHHGGAGTTATGLMAGKPTFIVPFFGDQPFWGAACALAGVGPEPVPIDDLTVEGIVDALKELILPLRQAAAQELAKRMAVEDGVGQCVDHIHRTFYSALVGGQLPVWMRPDASAELAAPLTGTQQDPCSIPTTRIDQLEGEEGEGFLEGVLMLPNRLARNMADMFSRRSSRKPA
ncbi:hypothetical protein QJQ45_005588 [Haematococcus lacustris]|nr:hypothetical protein QJQ45_005588 [Haematococcus lacustris]